MPIIGLTGSIASGKSLVSRILKEKGISVIDADEIARDVVKPGLKAWKGIIETFGTDVLNPDQTINRQRLGSIVFGNPELLGRLNNITHPAIIETISRQMEEFRNRPQADHELMVIDVPLLIETGLDKLVDQVWVVDVPEHIQLERLMKRDNITQEQAVKKIRSQMSTKEKRKYAHVVIDNTGSPEKTREAVEDLLLRSGVEKIETE